MKLRSALLAATILAAAPVAAKAQAISGLYIGAGAGVNFMQNQTLKSVAFPNQAVAPFNVFTPGIIGGNVRMDDGFVGVLSVGYGLGNGLRFEVEGSFRQNKFTRIGDRGGNVASLRAGGDEQKYGGMVNVLYDFDPAVLGMGFLPVVPYIGGGLGYQWAQHKNAHISGNTIPVAGAPAGFANLFRSNDGQGSFAYQAIVGVSFPITAVPGLSLTAEYRFMGLADNRTYNYQFFANGPTPGGINTRARLTFDDDFNHSILLGVRYAFNAAPPPAPVAVAPPPAREAARTYLVFFDWDRADLTDRARQVIAEAAQATTRVQVTRIEVNGYTDLSGTARYNQGLSVRRAQNVANELVRLGVPRSAIVARGFGESNPLVPTAKGVREPQNRRVEIILR
ncbi:MAG TPA: OmpA family protein [Acetobacteraceae bacterium]|jgi:outer membrane protein OmpA-like peptidoglycan-associated protein|nr:OmpA family protein [Acetobacteraceae bacterium]